MTTSALSLRSAIISSNVRPAGEGTGAPQSCSISARAASSPTCRLGGSCGAEGGVERSEDGGTLPRLRLDPHLSEVVNLAPHRAHDDDFGTVVRRSIFDAQGRHVVTRFQVPGDNEDRL